MLADGLAALHAIAGVFQCLLIGGPGKARERRRHRAVGEGKGSRQLGFVALGRGKHVMARDANAVEKDFTLVEPTLPELVERLAFGDSGSIERYKRDAASRHPVPRFSRAIERGVRGEGAVRDPSRLLAGDDVAVAITTRDDL